MQRKVAEVEEVRRECGEEVKREREKVHELERAVACLRRELMETRTTTEGGRGNPCNLRQLQAEFDTKVSCLLHINVVSKLSLSKTTSPKYL